MHCQAAQASRKKQSDESEETAFVLDSTIRIGDAIEKALPSMKLSKVVDSIVYVPLETKNIFDQRVTTVCKALLVCNFPGRLFDAKGKYVKQIRKNWEADREKIPVHGAIWLLMTKTRLILYTGKQNHTI